MPFHIHVPKPLHGWRAMLNEILVIVIGILLALGFEQCVEWAHWKEKVAEGETQLSEETLGAVALSAQYFAVSPCVHAQLAQVRLHLLQDVGKRADLPRLSDETEEFVVRVPTTPKYSTKWQALITDGTITHMDSARASRFAQFYESVDQQRQLSQLAFDQARNLLVLSDPVVIDNATSVRELEVVERLASLSTTNRSVAMRALRFYRDLGFAVPGQRLDTYVANSAVGHFCKAHGYPVDDWRKAFEEKLPQMSI